MKKNNIILGMLLKAGLFHLVFNFMSIILGLIFFDELVEFVSYVSTDKSIASQIANAHILFNIVGVLVFIPFAGLIERTLNFLLPDKKIK